MITCSPQPPQTVFVCLWPESPVGPVLLGLTARGALCRLSFLSDGKTGPSLKRWQKEWPATIFTERKEPLARLPHKIELVGTPFQLAVWQELLNIPTGETITYGEMARRIGKPKAARAVGGALGANPVPWLVPCHRVIAAQGKIGGFSAGLQIKRALLASEA